MGLYSKPALELLCAQLYRDNPTMGFIPTPSNLVLLSGPLTTGLGTSGRNTRILINGKAGTSSGKRELFYDRLALNKAFNSHPVNLLVRFPIEVVTVADALPTICAAFGLVLDVTDITDSTTVLPQGKESTSITITVASTCLSYTGSFTFNWKRGSGGYYPNSGPGSKELLMGSLTEGYFGVVPASEVFTASEFFYMAVEDKSRGSSYPINTSTLFYLKFAIDNKFIFVPSVHLVANITWAEIYSLGAVDGSFGLGSYPPSGLSVIQDSTVYLQSTDRDWLFKVRLPKFSASDPVASVRGDLTSEVERLFNKIHKGTYGLGTWDTQTVGTAALDLTTSHWWLNSLAGTEASAHYSTLNLATLSTLAKTTVGNWRPVLEIADPGEITVALRSITSEVTGTPAGIEFVISASDVTVPLSGISADIAGAPAIIPWTWTIS